MRTLLLFFLGFLSNSLIAQKEPLYTIVDVKPVKVISEPLFLDVTDSLNRKRNIYKPPFELGGLYPLFPMAISHECLSGKVFSFIDCLQKTQTLISCCTNYLVEINDSIIEINSAEQFRRIFAPVETKEEAISFAFALCGYSSIETIYDFSFLRDKGTDYEFFRKELKSTTVSETEEGYEVILFSTYYGSKSYCSERTIQVSREGYVKILDSVNLFRDKNYTLIIN